MHSVLYITPFEFSQLVSFCFIFVSRTRSNIAFNIQDNKLVRFLSAMLYFFLPIKKSFSRGIFPSFLPQFFAITPIILFDLKVRLICRDGDEV